MLDEFEISKNQQFTGKTENFETQILQKMNRHCWPIKKREKKWFRKNSGKSGRKVWNKFGFPFFLLIYRIICIHPNMNRLDAYTLRWTVYLTRKFFLECEVDLFSFFILASLLCRICFLHSRWCIVALLVLAIQLNRPPKLGVSSATFDKNVR